MTSRDLNDAQAASLAVCTREAQKWIAKGWRGGEEYLQRCQEEDNGRAVDWWLASSESDPS